MFDSKVDVPVMLIFFNRPESFRKVFEAVKCARPSKLFLVQDGAREGNKKDLENVELCRKIADDIDWKCDVKKFYSSVNLGCGMRMYTGISECFKMVDELIILEDDCVPNFDFFLFCKEMLDKYKNDQRINMICGMNNLEVYKDTEYSYLFSSIGSCWGWATWKRVWNLMDYNMNFINDIEAMTLINNLIKPIEYRDELVKTGKERYALLNSGKKLTAWTYQFGMIRYLYSQLIIVPKVNLICNKGLTSDSTHAVNSINKIPKDLQHLFNMKTYNLNFPLNHPNYIIENRDYYNKVRKIMRWDKKKIIESYVRQFLYSNKAEKIKLIKKFKNKLTRG
ncbi:hypothetical protein [Thomasclavelia spiroformis]|uniref:hypothetical protein n=1 Tax=Thomasclavelia spiroformis TaxID=29348 RepID=UPI003995F34A